ncbi:hypothetical protein [Arthrobacter sp. ov118]|uniref:hypothetical protein n=1 Tax=Arthrobacter sp. ov118 TaxID=1761747 RepID=UPI0008F067B4|nr:hypothetical protein [Arthrobacter sp. ov118]SFU13299.1 hypothetical protein SAMN04487915_112106 [Arthrobacter sp. ov118]
MIGILQWTTLAVCGVVTLARIPSALRGENRSLFSIFALATLAILLSIDGPYLVVDRALGGLNIANLVLRFVIFAAIFFLGLRVARGFSADDALRLITGPIGIGVAAAASAAVVAVFLLMDTSGSSAGMTGIFAKDPRNAALVEYYGAAGRLYPAYVTAALFPAMLRTFRSRFPALVRSSAALMALGTVGICLSLLSPVIPPSLGILRYVFNYTAALCLILGLALIWLAKVLAQRAQKKQSVLTRW